MLVYAKKGLWPGQLEKPSANLGRCTYSGTSGRLVFLLWMNLQEWNRVFIQSVYFSVSQGGLKGKMGLHCSFLYFVLWFYFAGTHQEESHVMCCYMVYLLLLPCCVHVFREFLFHDPPLVFNTSHKQSSCWFNIWIHVEAEVNLAVLLCCWWVVCSKRNGAAVQEVS